MAADFTKSFRLELSTDAGAAISGLTGLTSMAEKAEMSTVGLIEATKKLDSTSATVVLALKGAEVQQKLTDVLQEVARLDSKDVTIGIKIDQANALKSDLDKIGAKIRELDGTPVDLDTRPARRGIDEIGRSAHSSRSVLANMVGNSVQDLGALGGVAGSAGVAISQMGEYMADALGQGEKLGSVIGSFGKVAGPLAAVAVVTAVATSAWNNYKKSQEEARKATEGAVEAMAKELGLVDRLNNLNLAKATTSAELFNKALITNEGDRTKAIASLGALDKVSSDLGQTMIGLERDSRGTLTALAQGAGIPADLAAGVAKAVDESENFKEIQAKLINQFGTMKGLAIAEEYQKQIKALEELNDQQQKNDVNKAAQGELDRARGIDTATAALVDQAEATARAVKADADAVDILDQFIRSQAGVTDETRQLSSMMVGHLRGIVSVNDAETHLTGTYQDQLAAVDKLRTGIENKMSAALSASAASLDSASADLRVADAVDKYNEMLSGTPPKLADVARAQDALTKAKQRYDDSLKVTMPTDREKEKALIDLQTAQTAYNDLQKGTGRGVSELDRHRALFSLQDAQMRYDEILKGSSATVEEQQRALEGVTQAQADYDTTTRTVIHSEGEKKQAYIDVQRAINDSASAHAREQEVLQKSAGLSWDVRDSLDAQIVSLGNVEKTLAPGSSLFNVIAGHIQQLRDQAAAADRAGTALYNYVNQFSGSTGVGGVGATPEGNYAAGTSRVPGPKGAPMLAVVHGGEEITPTWAMPRRGGGGGGSTIINQYFEVHPAADQASVGRAIEEARRAWLKVGGKAA